MVNLIDSISDDEFRSLITNSENISEVLFKLGYSINENSWGFGKIKRRMQDMNIPYSSFKGKAPITTKKAERVPDSKLFCERSKHNRNVVRKRIITNNLLPYKCAICGVDKWNDKSISLDIDHINGVNDDNRIENLRFLCPNCHSQCDTTGSRNKNNLPISEEFKDMIIKAFRKTPSIKKLAAKLGISEKYVKQAINEVMGISKSKVSYIVRYEPENMKVIAKYGSVNEAARTLMEDGELKTKSLKSARSTLLRNIKDEKKLYLNSYWRIINQ